MDPFIKVIFEWDTGDVDNRITHSVALSIPPSEINIRMNKNIQKTLTTKGFVFNHSQDELPTIAASGTAYQNPSEAQLSNASLSGLEYLQAAYVSSGKSSTNPTLTKTIQSSATLGQSIKTTSKSLSNFGPLSSIAQTLFQRSAVLNQVSGLAKQIGIGTDSSGNLVFNNLPDSTITNSVVTNIKNSVTSYSKSLNTGAQLSIDQLMKGLTTQNAEQVLVSLSSLSSTYNEVALIAQRFQFIKDSYLSSKDFSSFSPILDPTLIRALRRDPAIAVKALASQNLSRSFSNLNNSLNTVKDKIASKTDYVILITMYWQDMVFRGHFRSFNFKQSANVIGMWTYDFVFIAQESWLLKTNNVIPIDRAFDKNITTQTRKNPSSVAAQVAP